jgi:S1 RNA binding domain protein
MDVEVGSILTGKVSGITKFGAFVTVAPGQSGLVHISEIAHTYVNNVSDHLALGQDVTVKVLGTQMGKLNLSIKAVTPPPAHQEREARPRRAFAGGGARNARADGDTRAPRADDAPPPARPEPTFEDRLKRFMQDSDSKISGLRMYSDKKGHNRRRSH